MIRPSSAGQLAVAGDDADVENVVIPLVLETSEALEALDFRRRELAAGGEGALDDV